MPAEDSICLREMEQRDISPVLDLINAEGWNYDTIDIERILQISPHDSIVACSRNEVVGALTATQHSTRAVLGHVVVRADSRRKSIGRMMMRRSLDSLDSQGMQIVELYSVPEAKGFYSGKGFRKIGDLTIFEGRPATDLPIRLDEVQIRNLVAEDLEEVRRLDRDLLGWDRSKIIEILMLPYLSTSFGVFSKGTLTGFALGRLADNAAEVGPWMMREPDYDTAKALLVTALRSLTHRSVYVEINNDNLLATKVASDIGLKPIHPVERMVRSKLDVGDFNKGVMSYAALEFG
jgi:predicted N-acetyltransferase YhbS